MNASQLNKLRDQIKVKVAFQKQSGALTAIGLQEKRSWFGNPFLYSDFRTMAAVYSVFAKDKPKSAETQAILNYILAGAGESGWGDTYTNSEVLASLVDALRATSRKSSVAELWDGKAWRSLDSGGKAIVRLAVASDAPLKARLKSFDPKAPPSLIMQTDYVPAAPGSQLAGGQFGLRGHARAIGLTEKATPLPRAIPPTPASRSHWPWATSSKITCACSTPRTERSRPSACLSPPASSR